MAKTTKSFLALLRGGNLGVPLVILCILAMVILPLPPALLDILFTFNIVLAVMVLLVAVSAKRPLEFSLFPTILLITTLMRLTLNVASTRVVLLHEHLGAGAAGKVIESFGQVVIGGNFVVGFVVFIILMIINFIVVTKGAERISEVSARFTLDAMPGKQMAIDADLNAGLINQAQAQTRRKDVASEALPCCSPPRRRLSSPASAITVISPMTCVISCWQARRFSTPPLELCSCWRWCRECRISRS